MSCISLYQGHVIQTRKSIVTHIVDEVFAAVDRTIAELKIWRRRSRERAELRGMTALELQDLGMSRADVFYESAKPLWRE